MSSQNRKPPNIGRPTERLAKDGHAVMPAATTRVIHTRHPTEVTRGTLAKSLLCIVSVVLSAPPGVFDLLEKVRVIDVEGGILAPPDSQ